MVTLPPCMPAAFDATYTPIAAAGTSTQIRHLARLLAAQLVVWAADNGEVEAEGEAVNRENCALVRQLLEVEPTGLGAGGSNAESSGNRKPFSRVNLLKELTAWQSRCFLFVGDETKCRTRR